MVLTPLVPQVGQFVEVARAGFQVHFVQPPTDAMGIGGALTADAPSDVMHIDVMVMDDDVTAQLEHVIKAV